jgi:hypothetical protein
VGGWRSWSPRFGRQKSAGDKILAVIQEYKTEINRKKKTAIPGKEIEDEDRKKRRWLIPVG